MNDTTTPQDPAAIEQEIRRTQDSMSRTVGKIGGQLTLKNVFNSLLDKADENNVDARMLLDGARRNPIALGLIAAGAIWLVSDSDSNLPSFGDKTGKPGDKEAPGLDLHHRDYVSHMSSVEQRSDEDAASYQRRRDTARSNFMMVERGHDEDDSSFRQRLDAMTESFRQKRQAWADAASQAQDATTQKAKAVAGAAQNLGSKVQSLYTGNPLVGGILAAALGAALGSAAPITDLEQDKLGDLGDKARDVIDEHKEQVSAQLRDKKDELLEKADAALKPSADASPHGQPDGAAPTPQAPFIAAS